MLQHMKYKREVIGAQITLTEGEMECNRRLKTQFFIQLDGVDTDPNDRVLMVGARVSVWLNGKQIVDHAILENYYDRKASVPAKGPICLQTHGAPIRWRNIAIREIVLRTAHSSAAFSPGVRWSSMVVPSCRSAP